MQALQLAVLSTLDDILSRLSQIFRLDGEADLATTLTVKFPTALSNELTESPLIDDALTRFVTRE